MRGVRTWAGIAGLMLACGAAPAAGDADGTVLAVGALPDGSERGLLRGWRMGGVSGAARVEMPNRDGIALMLADDRGEHGPPRIASVITGSGRDTDGDGDNEFSLGMYRWRPLLSPEGVPFPPDTVDPEAVIIVDHRPGAVGKGAGTELPVIVWSSEGYVRGGSMPGIYFWDWLDPASVALPVPQAFLPESDASGAAVRGITHNRGFESLALLPDGSFLAAPECPLVQDVAAGRADMIRMVRYVSTGRRGINAEVLRQPYEPAEFVFYERAMFDAAGDPREQGLTEMMVLPDGRVLVLERSPNTAGGHHAKLFLVDLDGASRHPVAEEIGADEVVVPARRREVFDFSTIAGRFPGGVVPNLEAMFIGPGIDNGEGTWITRPLVVLSDNDFADGVPTAYAALDLSELLAGEVVQDRQEEMNRPAGAAP
jgi:hypothetical protein